MKDIEEAILLAASFHHHQKDDQGLPYIYHPIYVMNSMPLDDIDGRKVAILHDIVEGTDCTLEYLRAMGFANHIVDAVDAISQREGESYDDYIKRVKDNVIATRVKIMDVSHNYVRSLIDQEAAIISGDKKALAKAERRIKKYQKALYGDLDPKAGEEKARADYGVIS